MYLSVRYYRYRSTNNNFDCTLFINIYRIIYRYLSEVSRSFESLFIIHTTYFVSSIIEKLDLYYHYTRTYEGVAYNEGHRAESFLPTYNASNRNYQ